jgi:hypothetical protein
VRQGSHRDRVDTRTRELRHALDRDPARRLDERTPPHAPHGLLDHARRQVVEQHDVRAGDQRLFQLFEGLDLALDLRGVRSGRPRALDCGAHAATRRDVVVLDEHRGAEVVAVVVAPAHADGVALERAQTWRGLSRVGDARFRPGGERIDVRARLRRHSAHVRDQVERRALRHQDRPRAAAHAPELRARARGHALCDARLDDERLVYPREDASEDRTPASHQWLASDGARRGSRIRVDACLRGDVARREILLESEGDDAVDEDGGEQLGERLCHEG